MAAIESNKSDKKVVNEKVLYTGLVNVNVVAVNPNQAELKAMGINAKEEVVYTTDVDAKEGVPAHKKTRLDFYISAVSPLIKTKLTLWLEDSPRVNKNGDKHEYINKVAQSTWSPIGMEPTYDWFKKEGVRVAKIGEVTLHEFLSAWANVESNKNCQLETIAKIAIGDVTELKGLVAGLKENLVKVLLGVNTSKDGNRYQTVYTKHFGRSYQGAGSFVKALENQYGEFKDADYQNSLELKTYQFKLAEPDASPAAANGQAAQAPAGGINF